ncbi:hypothetical protein KUCAC02_025885 [Chaenocephalus aceratus]|uniref:Uncharacterized protein n=1 Tax=Chaenocephalus aceratus TaxID=36190 RepID=A0ACB9VWD3_CHAAC|nr:hypothetical protein KUCAC02_025885 [Chaenocephalus aceratus]
MEGRVVEEWREVGMELREVPSGAAETPKEAAEVPMGAAAGGGGGSTGVVEDISEASEMEEGEPDVGEGPMGAMVFGCSNGKPRGPGHEERQR